MIDDPGLLRIPALVFLGTAILSGLFTLTRARWQRRLRLAGLKGTGTADPAKGGGGRLAAMLGPATDLAARLDRWRGEDAEQVAARLVRAGLNGAEWRVVHSFAKSLPLGLGLILTGLWCVAATRGAGDLYAGLFAVLAGTLALMRLPDLWLEALCKRRNRAIHQHFAGMLELVGVASEAGLAPAAALRRVAAQMAATCPILAAELERLLEELSLLADRTEAYDRLARRINLPEVAAFAQTMAQTERFGTPFSAAIRATTAELRAHRLLRIEEKAGRVPVLMAVPLIVFIMPALFVVIAGPAALGMADTILSGEVIE